MNKFAFISLFTASFSFGQQVKFQNSQLENGLLYPTVIIAGESEIQGKINSHITEQVNVYAQQDMCIGQFGFVQKGMYIQINQYVNCMEMASSVNHYMLFDLKTGAAIPVSEMVDPNRKSDFDTFLSAQITEHLKKNGVEITPELEQKISKTRMDDFNAIFGDEGINFTPKNLLFWSGSSLTLSWNNLERFLKVRLI